MANIKYTYSATTSDGKNTVTRTSPRDYPFALAVHVAAEPQWEDRHWEHNLIDGAAPEGFEVIHYGQRNGQDDKTSALVGRRIADKPERWGVISFHGSESAATKAFGQYAKYPRYLGFEVVPTTIIKQTAPRTKKGVQS